MKAPFVKKPKGIVKPWGQLGPNKSGTAGRAMTGAVASGGGHSHYLGSEHLSRSLLSSLDLLLLLPWAGLHWGARGLRRAHDLVKGTVGCARETCASGPLTSLDPSACLMFITLCSSSRVRPLQLDQL